MILVTGATGPVGRETVQLRHQGFNGQAGPSQAASIRWRRYWIFFTLRSTIPIRPSTPAKAFRSGTAPASPRMVKFSCSAMPSATRVHADQHADAAVVEPGRHPQFPRGTGPVQHGSLSSALGTWPFRLRPQFGTRQSLNAYALRLVAQEGCHGVVEFLPPRGVVDRRDGSGAG